MSTAFLPNLSFFLFPTFSVSLIASISVIFTVIYPFYLAEVN